MRRVISVALLAAGVTTAARSQVQVLDAGSGQLRPKPVLLAGIAPAEPAEHRGGRLHLHFGHAASIRTVAGGINASPFVTALPGEIWHGRLRSFGAADGAGFSGIALRARSVGFSGLQSENHVSGFLASEFRYGIGIDEVDLLIVDLDAASQRMPPRPTIGRARSIRVNSLYLGAALVHGRHFSLTGGWYRLSVSDLSALDYAIERTAGMPAAGQGLRLGCDWRLGQAAAAAPARIGIEMRDGDADRDRLLPFGPAARREHRLLLRFSAPF